METLNGKRNKMIEKQINKAFIFYKDVKSLVNMLGEIEKARK